MKTIRLIALLSFVANCSAIPKIESDPNCIVAEMHREISFVVAQYELLLQKKYKEISEIDGAILRATSNDKKVDLLVSKSITLSEIRQLKTDSTNEISKIRYLKGLQIIKILYEKVLGLDHHFASVRTFNEINKISNPNQYPEYSKLKEILAASRERKNAFDLTAVLGTNTIATVMQTFTAMISSNLSKQEKEKELANVECILDFTLRMQNDLNTIYFETAFLQASNDKIKEEIEILFRD